jgi:hypothetical protein
MGYDGVVMNTIHLINDILNEPIALMALFGIVFLLAMKKNNVNLPQLVTAFNSLASQPTAIFVLIIGFWMLLECKRNGIDTTIAGGVIGAASNMLTGQIKDSSGQLHLQPLPPAGDPTVPK